MSGIHSEHCIRMVQDSLVDLKYTGKVEYLIKMYHDRPSLKEMII